jgi:flagellar assembly factor FliW
MELKSKLLGTVEYSAESVIKFEEGLIGITDKKDFLFIEKKDFLPFSYLQSVDDPDFSLIVINPFFVDKEYDYEISKDDLKALNIKDDSDFFIVAIVVFANNIENITVNLRAPIVINIKTKKAKQVLLLNDNYDIEESLVKKEAFKSFLEEENK